MMTAAEYRYMLDLKGLDDRLMGMLSPSEVVPEPERIRDRLADRGWVRLGKLYEPWGRCAYLTTRGLRALQREAKRRALESIRKASARRVRA